MSPSSTSGRSGGNRGPAMTPGRSGGNRSSVTLHQPTGTHPPQTGGATPVATPSHLTKVQPVKPVLEPAKAQDPPEEVLQALQDACKAKKWEKVRQLLLQNPMAFSADAGSVLTLESLDAEDVSAFCGCIPWGVSLPNIWFEGGRIGYMPDKHKSNPLTYLTSHPGLRGLGFRECGLGAQVLNRLADGAEQRQQRGDRGLQTLVFEGGSLISSSKEAVSGVDMARLIARSPHLETLMISDQRGVDLSEVIGALAGLKDLQTLVIKSLRLGSLSNENMAAQWRKLAENPPPITTIVLDGWDLNEDTSVKIFRAFARSLIKSEEAWVDDDDPKKGFFCDFVARIPGCVTVEVGLIQGDAACNFMRMLGDALNSRTEPFRLAMTTKRDKGGWEGWSEKDRSAFISAQTAILEKLSSSAPVHSLQVSLGAGEWNKDSTPVRAITAVLNRIGALQSLGLDIHHYEYARAKAHDVRSDLLVAIDAHPSLSSLAFPAEPSASFRPEEDPDWKRLILGKRIQKVVQEVPIGNLPGEVPGPLMGEQDPSPVVHRRWADQIRAQLNQQNHNL